MHIPIMICIRPLRMSSSSLHCFLSAGFYVMRREWGYFTFLHLPISRHVHRWKYQGLLSVHRNTVFAGCLRARKICFILSSVYCALKGAVKCFSHFGHTNEAKLFLFLKQVKGYLFLF